MVWCTSAIPALDGQSQQVAGSFWSAQYTQGEKEVSVDYIVEPGSKSKANQQTTNKQENHVSDVRQKHKSFNEVA